MYSLKYNTDKHRKRMMGPYSSRICKNVKKIYIVFISQNPELKNILWIQYQPLLLYNIRKIDLKPFRPLITYIFRILFQ